MDLVFSNRIAKSRSREGKNSPRRAAILAILLGVVAFAIGCDRTRTSKAVVEGQDPDAQVRVEITSDPTGQVWVASVGDENVVTTINGETPFIQDFPAPDGLGIGVRKVSAGGVLAVCLTNLSTGERRCGQTTSKNGVVSIAVAN